MMNRKLYIHLLTFIISFSFYSSPIYAQFTQFGSKMVGTGAVSSARQGSSVSLSADGKTAFVGGYEDNNNSGAVWAYTFNGTNFVQTGSKLVGKDTVGSYVYQGASVSLSADGKTALVGGYGDNNFMGAVWVYTFNGTNFLQVGSKLVGTGAINVINGVYQGLSVSLSADGKTALVGGYQDNNNSGAVWVYTFNGTNFVQSGSKLVGTGAIDGIVGAFQGKSVSLSADGKTVLVGGYGDNFGVGAVWVYTFNGTNFVQVGSKLVGTGAVGSSEQGVSVSLSADGKTALVGGDDDNQLAGAVWVYTFNGTNFVQVGGKLVGTGAVGSASQGRSVSLSGDGKTALVGGYADNNYTGAVWVFTFNGANFVQAGSKLVGTGGVGGANQGSSVSLSADGKTALVGGYADNNYTGAVWVYTAPKTTTLQTILGFASTFSQNYSNSAYTISGVTATSELPVSFSGNNPSVAVVSTNGVISFVGVGNVTITASQVGNVNYWAASPVSQVLMVNQASQTITGFNPLPTQPIGLSSYTILGVLATSKLPVTFSGNDPTVAMVSSNGVVSFAGLGNVTITASQVGNTNYLAANPVSQVLFVVNQAPQSITGFNPLPNQTYGNVPYTITGVRATSGLPVTFSGNNPSVAVVSSNGVLSLVGVGNVTITASQVGNANYSSTSKSVAIHVLSVISTLTGIINQDVKEKFLVYPNPSEGSFTIEIDGSIDEKVAVFNYFGYKIADLSTGTNTLPRGLYLLMLRNRGKKLVIE